MILKDPFGFSTYRKFRANEPPEVPFIWGDKSNGLMQKKSFVMLHSGEKMGKSMFTLNLAIAGARGDDDFLGFKLKEGGFKTLIIQNEVHMRAMWERFKEMELGKTLTEEQADNILINTCRNVTLYDKGVFAFFRFWLWKWKPDLIVIDPLARLITTDENDNAAVGDALAPLLVIRDNPGAAILVVHHNSKVGESTSMRPAHQRSRGANRLTADPDSIISLSPAKRKGGPTVTMSCTPRYGRVMDPIRVRMNEETFWFERYTYDQEHSEVICAIIIELGGHVLEEALIEALETKWSLNDTQGRHRTARERIKKAIEEEFVMMTQQGTSVFYDVVQKED